MKSNVWETIRNVCAILGGIWVCIQLVNFISSKSTKLVAEIDETNYHVPTYFSNSFNAANKEMERLFTLAYSSSDSTTKAILIDSATRTSNYLLSLSDRYNFNKQIIIKLKNTGDRELSGIKIIPKTDFCYEYTYAGRTNYGKSMKRIEIGALPPSEELYVYLWGNYSLYKEDINITHLEGKAKIRYYSHLIGTSAIVAKFFSGSNLTFFLPLFIYIILYTIIMYKRNKKKSTTENEENDT